MTQLVKWTSLKLIRVAIIVKFKIHILVTLHAVVLYTKDHESKMSHTSYEYGSHTQPIIQVQYMHL